MTLKRLFMLKNPPARLNLNTSAKRTGSKFLHSDVKEPLPAITNAWLQLLLPRVTRAVIRFWGQLLFFFRGWYRFGITLYLRWMDHDQSGLKVLRWFETCKFHQKQKKSTVHKLFQSTKHAMSRCMWSVNIKTWSDLAWVSWAKWLQHSYRKWENFNELWREPKTWKEWKKRLSEGV